MAHAYKIRSGLWRCWYKNYDGRRQFFTLTKAATKRDVETAAAQLNFYHARIRHGLLPRPDHQHIALTRAVGDVIAEYLAWGRSQGSPGGRPWTKTHLRVRTKQLQQWQAVLGLTTLGQCDGILPRVEEVLRQEEARGLSSQSRKHLASALMAFLRWCTRRDLLPRHPLAAMTPIHVTHMRVRRALTYAEIRRLLAACTPLHRLLYESALLTGLRVSELRQLSLDHLDLATCGVRLDASWTKNRQADVQPIPDELLAALYASGRDGSALAQYGLSRSRISHPARPLLFVPHSAVRLLDADLRRAEIAKVTTEGVMDFHALRTTFITVLIADGATYPEVQALARHKAVETTLRHYARARDARLTALVEGVSSRIMPQHPRASRVHEQAVGFAQTAPDLDDVGEGAGHHRLRALPRHTPHSPAPGPHPAAPHLPPNPPTPTNPVPGPHTTLFGPHAACAPDVHDGLEKVITQWPTLSAETRAAMLQLLETGEVAHA
jgi:integrase